MSHLQTVKERVHDYHPERLWFTIVVSVDGDKISARVVENEYPAHHLALSDALVERIVESLNGMKVHEIVGTRTNA